MIHLEVRVLETQAELVVIWNTLTSGVVIHDRYRVLSVVSEGYLDLIYEVQDLLLCWNLQSV